MGRGVIEPERPVKVTDLLIRQKVHAQTWGLRQKLLGELTFTRETRHAV